MRFPKLGPNFAVFLLFFGVAALDAFRNADWLRALLWAAIGLVFLFADNLKKQTDQALCLAQHDQDT